MSPQKAITQAEAAALPTADKTIRPLYSIVTIRKPDLSICDFILITKGEASPQYDQFLPIDHALYTNDVVWQQAR